MRPNPSVEFDIVIKTREWVQKLEREKVLKNLNKLMDEVWKNPLYVMIEVDNSKAV